MPVEISGGSKKGVDLHLCWWRNEGPRGRFEMQNYPPIEDSVLQGCCKQGEWRGILCREHRVDREAEVTQECQLSGTGGCWETAGD